MKPEDDVVSLVDVATIFVRRWVAAVVVFLAVVAIGVGYAVTLEDTRSVSYTTTIQPATLPGQNDNTATLLTLINTKWMAEAEAEFESGGKKPKVPVNVREVKGTRFIEIVSRGAQLPEQAVVEFHRTLADLVVAEQNVALEQRVRLFEGQIAEIEAIINSVQALPRPPDVRIKMELERNAQSGEPAEVLMLAAEQRKIDRAPSLKKVAALSAVIGIVFGFVAPFLVEFLSLVRRRLREQKAS